MNARFTNSLVKSSFLVAAVAVALTGCGGSGANTGSTGAKLAASYSLEIVEGPAGSSNFSLEKISPGGMVAGTYSNGTAYIAFTYSSGVRTDRTPTNASCDLTSVSDTGTLEGQDSLSVLPYSTAGAGYHLLQQPANVLNGWNSGRDTSGNAFLTFNHTNGHKVAMRESGGAFTPLSVAGATDVGFGNVSPSGYAIGYAYFPADFGYYIFTPGATTGVKTLSSINTSDISSVNAINDSGTIGGSVKNGSGSDGFVSISGQIHTFAGLGGQNCYVNALNNANIGVGASNVLNSPDHAFGWTSSDGIVDLNTRIPSTPGFTAAYANGIDTSGRIIGAGFLNGKQVGFIMTPVNP